MGLFSCSSDDDLSLGNGGGAAGGEGDVYATLTLKLPTGTRAGEGLDGSNAGDEYGKDYENSVGSILVVLAEKTEDGKYKYLTSSLSDGQLNGGTGVSPVNPKYTLVFQNATLAAKAGSKVSVFAYANPTSSLRGAIDALEDPEVEDKSFTDLVADFDAEIWANNRFLMTSVETVSADIPDATALASEYNKPEKAFDLGTVPVVRAAARFDYKQVKGNKYEIKTKVLGENNLEEDVIVGEVELTHMALFNLATKYYYLPRTSANGLNANITLCPGKGGMDYQWVVGPMADKFQNYVSTNNNTETGIGSYFQYALRGGDREWTEFSKLTIDDNHSTTWDNEKAPANEGYKIWRYATENTIPADKQGGYSAQKKGITTGVVFKGKINLVAGSLLAKNVNDNEDIYMFNGVMYGGIKAVYKAVKAAPVSTLAEAFNNCFTAEETTTGEGDDAVTTVTITPKTGEGSDVKENGFTVYKYDTVAGCYPVYYHYYNRHDDNGNNDVMGEMEFGVVRNNVYKLSVTNINQFGSPTDDDNPDDPDEEAETYFQVSVEVLPWVVRINNIEF